MGGKWWFLAIELVVVLSSSVRGEIWTDSVPVRLRDNERHQRAKMGEDEFERLWW